MRKNLSCIIFFLGIGVNSHSQTLRTPVTAAFTRLNTYSTVHTHAFSFAANQAALGAVKSLSAGIYSERRFLLKEMSLYSAAVALPTPAGNFGLKGDYFGDASYNETGLGLAYGRKLGDKIDGGVQFNYYSFKVAGYGSASSINAEGGMIIHLTEAFNVGVHLYNPTGVSVGKNAEEKLPAIYSAGFGYDVSKKFFIGAEVEKTEDQPVNVNAGMHYYFDEKMFASAGLASATATYYLGFGVMLKNMQLNAVASIHPQLGVTPGLLLLFNVAKGNE
ncbi:MAG TPA: hypothetical protein VEV15_04160 [Flavisolibacter sp.]|nr:hypothetical protein [Flavisolibacter sp.]